MDKPAFTFGSLFSGIGGLDLGLERAGMRCAWQVENNDFCQKVLAKHWPDVARHGDVRHVGKRNLAHVKLIAGGFPCQDISDAGQMAGITGERSGLWKEMHRVICELRPEWVLVENVSALTHRGIDVVLGDMAEARYDALWTCLRASDFGAPHIRERIFIVAHAKSQGQSSGGHSGGIAPLCEQIHDEPYDGSGGMAHAYGNRQRQWAHQQEFGSECYGKTNPCAPSAQGFMADTGSQRCEKWGATTGIGSQGQYPRSVSTLRGARATQPGLGGAASRIPSWLDRYRWPARPGQSQEAWEAPRVVVEKKINRTARLKGLGNAVVPALAEFVGRCIVAAEAERRVLA